MARLGVTKEDVFSACKALLKEGMTITVANVREELGTGSYTTLLPLIDDFKATASNEAALQEEVPQLPKDLSDMGSSFIKDLWWQAALSAQKRVDEVEKTFLAQIDELKKELLGKNEELSQAMSDIKGFESEIDKIKKDTLEKDKLTIQKDGEVSLLKVQLKEKDDEVKKYLERAVSAEKELLKK